MKTDGKKKRGGLLEVLLGRKSDGRLEGGEVASETREEKVGAPDAPILPEIWIEPVSRAAKRQTLLRKRRLAKDSLLIGRRGSIAELSEADAENYLISQPEPYTISKRQCEIVSRDGKVWVRDLGSRYGTRVNGRKIRSSRRKVAEVCLEPGEHTLIPGKRDGGFEFKVTVR